MRQVTVRSRVIGEGPIEQLLDPTVYSKHCGFFCASFSDSSICVHKKVSLVYSVGFFILNGT